MANNPRQRQSWKSGQQAKSAEYGSNRTTRWTVTLIAIGLICFFGWYLYRLATDRDMPTYIATVLPGDPNLADRLSVPQILFSEEEAELIAEIPAWDHIHPLSTILQRGNDVPSQLADKLVNLDFEKDGTLIVYVNAQGASNITGSETADLLCRDYRIDQHIDQRIDQSKPLCYAIDRLLDPLTASTARLKLLVLNTGQLAHDTRLGMVLNEFPILLEKAVVALDDDSVWVMISNDLTQTTFVSYAESRSVFGAAVASALAGNANQDDDSYVDLSEFYRYVLNRCDQATGGLQTPVLLQGGRGRFQMIKDIPAERLVQLGQPLGEDSQEDSPAEDSPPNDPESGSVDADSTKVAKQSEANAEPTAEGDGQTDLASDAPDGTSKSPAESEQTVQQTPADKVEKTLWNAWESRDKMVSLDVSDDVWLPLEFAPHLWRELDHVLLDFQANSFSRSDGELKNLFKDIEPHLAGLEKLENLTFRNESPTEGSPEKLVTDRLLNAGVAFAADSFSRPTFDTRSSDAMTRVTRAVRQQRRLLFLTYYFVRWHGNAVISAPQEDTLAGVASKIDDLIAQLKRFQQFISSVRGQNVTDSLALQLDSLRREQLEAFKDVKDRWNQRLNEALEAPREPVNRRQLESHVSVTADRGQAP